MAQGTGLMAYGGCDIAFTCTCASCNEYVFFLLYKVTTVKTLYLVFIDLPGWIIIDILHYGTIPELGRFGKAFYFSVLPVIPFRLHQISDQLVIGVVNAPRGYTVAC